MEETIRDLFPNLSPVKVMRKYDKSAFLQISQVFGTF